MFRKIIQFILALFFLVASTGITFSTHYCGDKIVCVSLTPQHQSCCAEGEVNCCKIATEKMQLDDIYMISKDNHLLKDFSKDLQFENQNFFKEAYDFTFFAHTQLLSNYKFHRPPVIQVILARLQTYRL